MISVTSVTDKYILQPTLIGKHKKTLEWLSSTILWKRELAFFQKLLDQFANKFQSTDEKKQIDHFQNLIIYYNGELVDSLASKLRVHEKKLAEMLELRSESKIEYFSEHEGLMDELESANKQFMQIKDDLFTFIEKAI
jgi:DNA primase large subunit